MVTSGWTRSRSRTRARTTLALAYALLVLSCDDPLSPGASVERVEATPAVLVLTVGETRTIALRIVNPSGAQIDRRSFWSTQNPTVATVTQGGLVAGVAPGNTQIAASAGGRSVVIPVTVNQRPVSLVRVTPATAQVEAGATTTLVAAAIDASSNVLAGRAILWATSSPAIATVTSTGQVTGVTAGSATITASSEGISGTSIVTVTPVPVAAVTVSPNDASLTTGQSLPLAATTVDSRGGALTGRVVTWATSSAAIASVSSTGVVTGVSPGVVTITATSEGKAGTAQLRVTLIPVDSVSISPSVATVTAGQTVLLNVRLADASGNVLTGRTVTWSSEQPTIASVNQSGLVSAIGAGAARISASIDGKSATATVNVSPIPIARIDVTPPAPSLLVGGTQQLTATPRDAQGNALSGRAITWISGSSTVASVSQGGLVTAVAPGSAVIFAASEGQVGSATVTVSSVAVATVSVTPPGGNIQQGQALQLTATPRDALGNILTGKPITWSSSNETIATVSSTGRVTAIAQGGVTITATIDGVAGAGSYTVTRAPVALVTVTPSVATLSVNGSIQLTANLFDATGNPLSTAGRVITWATLNPAVASVSPGGVVTAIASGSATISASSEGFTGTSTITVSVVAVASVALTPSPVPTLLQGSTQAVTATARDIGGNVLTGRPVTWSSSNVAVATVNTATTGNTNTITAVAAGSATISAVVDLITGVAPVTVIVVPIASITVTPNPGSVVEGSTTTLTATALDGSGNVLTGRTIVWSSNNAQVSVSQTGVVTAVINSASQSATITALSPNGGSGGSTPAGTATVSVSYAPVAAVLIPDPVTIFADSTRTLVPTLLSSGLQTLSATGRTLNWWSLDPQWATVSSSGVVTAVLPTPSSPPTPARIVLSAVSPGQSLPPGTEPADTSRVTVSSVPVATVNVAPASGPNPGTVHVGSLYSRQYSAATLDGNGGLLTGREITWTSLNQPVATVDAVTGIVTGLATGTADIRATSEGVNGNQLVTVDLVPVATVAVSPTSATLNPNTAPTVQLAAAPQDSAGNTIAGPALGGRATTWPASPSPAVATVNAAGLVTAVGAGNVLIGATIGGTSGTSSITVLAPVQSLTVVLTPADSVIAPGTLNGTVTAWSGAGGTGTALTGRPVSISSSNMAFATVSPASGTTNGSGQVAFTLTGVAQGNVTVDAFSEVVVFQSSATIRVLKPVEAITLTPPITVADSVIGTGTMILTATLTDAGGAAIPGRPITAVSTDSSKATFRPGVGGVSNASGQVALTVSGVAVGTTTLSVSAEGKNATRAFRVLAPVNSVSLATLGDSVIGTAMLAITPTLRDASMNALTGRPITWVSRTTATATVSSVGVVTGVAAGTSWVVATVETKSDSVLLRVLPAINAIALTPSLADSVIGTGTQVLTATATDASAAGVPGRPLSALSSSPGMATFTPASGNSGASGQLALTVTGVSVGTTTLSVTAEGKNSTRLFRVLAPVASVTLSAPGDSIISTGTLPVTATLRDASSGLITGRPTTWNSSNPAAATVSTSGVVTGVWPGSTNITATSEGFTSANFAIRVLPPVLSVTVSAPDSSVLVSQTIQATAVARDSVGGTITGRPVTWMSSVPAKATISNTVPTAGLITALDSGTTTITATVEGRQATFPFVVSLVPAATVQMTPASGSDSTGKNIAFTATPRDSIGGALSGRAITWASSNTTKASVTTGGVVTLLDSGSVNITATTTPGTGMGGTAVGTAPLTILLTKLDTVSVPATETATVGGTKLITATVTARSAPAVNRACTAVSSNMGVLTIAPATGNTDSMGQFAVTVTGVAAGTADVTVTCDPGTAREKSNKTTVTVS